MRGHGNLRWTLTLAAVMLLLTACATPYRPPAFAAWEGGRPDFPGIAQLAADGSPNALDVVMVHGMCTHGADWATDAIAALDRALGGSGHSEIASRPVAGTKATLFQARLTPLKGTVRVSALVWSPIVAPLKKQLCYDQTNKSEMCQEAQTNAPRYPYRRAALNRSIKDGLLDDCLADALIYQGLSRDAISNQIQTAILAAAAGEVAPTAARADVVSAATVATNRLVIIAESLGSKIAFDAIFQLINRGDPNEKIAGRATFERTVQIFMAANQLPMLALADQTLDEPSPGALPKSLIDGTAVYPGYPADSLGALMTMAMKDDGKDARAITRRAAPPRIVAFTDPNDLLSWTLAPSTQASDYPVVDVIVSNAPTYGGGLESPNAAHRGYLLNPDVLQLIACGHNAKAPCKQ